MLVAAGLVYRCVQITSGQLPLALHENRAAFKLYLVDAGMLYAWLRLKAEILFDEEARKRVDAGAITENYVAQALAANGLDLHYWISEGKAEVDFVIEGVFAKAIPLEVKSSGNVRSRSLSVYREKYEPPLSIRLSIKNLGREGGIKSVPLYAAFCLGLTNLNASGV